MVNSDSDTKPTTYEFVLWVPPHQIRKVRALNARWEPFLGNLLIKISDNVSRNKTFYDDLISQEIAKKDDLPLVNFFKDRDERNFESSAFVLKGAVGIGKSSFLNWWQSGNEVRSRLSAKIDINHEVKNVATNADGTKQYIQRRFADILLSKLKQSPQFNNYFSATVDKLKMIAEAQEYQDFRMGFKNQSSSFQGQFPDYSYDKLITSIIHAANLAFQNQYGCLSTMSIWSPRNTTRICSRCFWYV